MYEQKNKSSICIDWLLYKVNNICISGPEHVYNIPMRAKKLALECGLLSNVLIDMRKQEYILDII